MKLRMLQPMGGRDFSLAPGEVTERFKDKEAQRIIDAGFAERVDAPKKETTKKKTPAKRTATKKKPTILERITGKETRG